MRPVDPAAQALREARGGLAERVLVWIAARNRLTGDVEALGLWTGEDSETIAFADLWTGRRRPGSSTAPDRSSASRASATRPGSPCGRCGCRCRR